MSTVRSARFAALCLMAALALARPGTVLSQEQAGESRLMLSWHRPWGAPGAVDSLVDACNDTTGVDTLYLSFQPDRSYLNILAMEAVLFFHTTPGDTLEEFWFFKTGWPNEGGLLVEFDRRAGFPCEMPWLRMGSGRVSYDHRSGRGRLDLWFTVPPEPGRGVNGGEHYCVARVMFLHRRSLLPGCRQPVCIEWASLRLRPRHGQDLEITTGDRFVTWGRGAEAACSNRSTARVPKAWRPPIPIGTTFSGPPADTTWRSR